MKKGLVVSDAGPIFSLSIIGQLEILDVLFEEICISEAVWQEITKDKTTEQYPKIVEYFKDKVKSISGSNELTFVMDRGESESVVLYRELSAAYLLIDDKKARLFAEKFGVLCIGTLGVLSIARERRIVGELKPLFEAFIENNRYYSVKLLNSILSKYGEDLIE